MWMKVQMPKIITNKGCKQVGQAVAAERGEQVTFCGIIIADGNVIPPAYVFPRVRYKEVFLTGAPEGSIGLSSPSGWMTNAAFLEIMKHIKKHMHASKENPALILLDNHDTHASLDLIIYCRDNGLVLLTFPPHTTHRLQPLDVSVFGPFKARCRAAFNSWMSNHPGRAITIYDIASLSASAFNEGFSRQNIISGFLKTGCYPMNRNVFSDEDFMASQVTDIEDPQAPSPSSNINVEPNVQELATSSTAVPSPNIDRMSTTDEPKIKIISDIKLTPEQVMPYPKANRPKSTKGRKKKYSAILTSTPEKTRIENEQNEKEKRKQLQEEKRTNRNRKKKRLNMSGKYLRKKHRRVTLKICVKNQMTVQLISTMKNLKIPIVSKYMISYLSDLLRRKH